MSILQSQKKGEAFQGDPPSHSRILDIGPLDETTEGSMYLIKGEADLSGNLMLD